MIVVLTTLHVIVCIFLVAVVLLQRGKGAEIGAVFGGGASSTVFGSRGAGNFLTKLTTGSAIVFMMTSLTLSYLYTESSGDQLFRDGVTEEPVAEESLFEEVETIAPEDLGTAEAETAPEPGTEPEAP
jgi:preprotein translocase subunit SecG